MLKAKTEIPKNGIVAEIKQYFSTEEDVLLAFLFGSVSKSREGALSDIDIAVYLKDEAVEMRIWCGLERLLKKEVDLIVLNRALPVIAWEALRGVPLAMKDRRLYLDLVISLSREATDFMERRIDMWRMKEEIKCAV